MANPTERTPLIYTEYPIQPSQTITKKESKKCKWFCISVSILLSILLIIGVTITIIYLTDDEYTENIIWPTKMKRILFYNPSNSNYYDYKKSQLFQDTDYYDHYCEDNCIIKLNRNQDSFETEEYDAIIFDGLKAFEVPKNRNWNQIYVYAIDGYANYTEMRRNWRNNFFNMTLTHRHDSNIIWQRYKMIENYNLIQSYGSSSFKTAFVIVKETREWSIKNQLEIINEMKKIIDIDIYGDGFEPIFDRDSYYFKNYYFYLTFDTDSCSEYVDDYFYEAFIHNIVPVTLNHKYYSHLIPSTSFISKVNYESYESLAKYLNKIKDSEIYDHYRAWHKDYKVERAASNLCKICDKLDENFGMNSYDNIINNNKVESWMYNNNCY